MKSIRSYTNSLIEEEDLTNLNTEDIMICYLEKILQKLEDIESQKILNLKDKQEEKI